MRIIMLGAAVILALVFLPGLLKGGSGEASSAGRDAGNSALTTVKDPQKVGAAASKVVDPVLEVATPWWKTLYAQPWFWTAVVAGAAAILCRNWWRGMGPSSQKITIGVVVALIFFLFMAFSR